METATFTANTTRLLDAPSLASAVAESVDNFHMLLIMNQTQAAQVFKERRRWTVTAVMNRILIRLTWYHFLTPSESIDPAPVRGRAVSRSDERQSETPEKLASGRWDVFIP